MRRLAAVIALAFAAATVAGGGAAAAQSGGAEISGSPATVAVGEVSTITATGLGGLETAFFGLGDVSGAAMLSTDGSTYDTSAQVSASDGTATVSFMASQPGSYDVDVTDGETPLATTTITVTGGDDGGATITASPASIAAGGQVTITATGLGGLETAQFGLGGGAGDASLDPTSATVTDGSATTTFTASQPGTYTVDVTDGETPLASVEVTVTAASPTPTASPTPPPTPPETGVPVWVVVLIVVIAVLLVATILATVLVQSRRRRGSTGA